MFLFLLAISPWFWPGVTKKYILLIFNFMYLCNWSRDCVYFVEISKVFWVKIFASVTNFINLGRVYVVVEPLFLGWWYKW